MKKLIAVAALAGSLVLNGCATVGDGTTGPTLDAIIAQTQAYAVKLCGFAPAGNVIAGIIGTVVPGAGVVVSAAAIGSAICEAIAPPKMLVTRQGVRSSAAPRIVKGFRVAPGTVNGVPVR